MGACVVIAGFGLDWLVPCGSCRPICPRGGSARWCCPRAGAVRLGHRYDLQGRLERPTNLPTTAIVESGPYRFTRNPIYLGMFLGLIGLAIAFDNLWLLIMLALFARHPLRRGGPRGSLSRAQVR